MNENTKNIASGFIGLLVGILLTVFGVSELNSRFMSAAEDVGKTKKSLEIEKEKIDKIKKESKKHLENLAEQKKQLERTAQEIDKLFYNITRLTGPDAEKSIAKIQRLAASVNEPDALNRLLSVENELKLVQTRIPKSLKWPHAINCGKEWDALYVLHGSPHDASGLAWYVQVYPSEYRYVRFNGDLSFHDRAGHDLSSAGCQGKSIDQLKSEGRAFQHLMAQ